MDELGTELNGVGRVDLVAGPDPPSDTVAGLEESERTDPLRPTRAPL